MEIRVIGVLGAGSMGNGIAQVAAQTGQQVVMRDIIDIALHVTEYLYKELNKENKWSASTLLRSMIRAGKLGKKTKAGWYRY